MEKFCSKCGSEISPADKFCSKCGAPVADAPAESAGDGENLETYYSPASFGGGKSGRSGLHDGGGARRASGVHSHGRHAAEGGGENSGRGGHINKFNPHSAGRHGGSEAPRRRQQRESVSIWSWHGRISGLTLILWNLLFFALSVPIWIAYGLFVLKAMNSEPESFVESFAPVMTFSAILVPVALVFSWLGMMLIVKRFHDFDVNGWIAFLCMVIAGFIINGMQTLAGMILKFDEGNLAGAIVGVVLSFVLNGLVLVVVACIPGTKGFNQYGYGPMRLKVF